MPTKALLGIVRYLLVFKNPIVLEPLREEQCRIAKGSLGIMTVSRQLTKLALAVLWGENIFAVSEVQYWMYNRYLMDDVHRKETDMCPILVYS